MRYWLIGLNIVMLGIPSVAAASDAGQVAGEIALGCCARIVGAALKSAASPKKKLKTTPDPRLGTTKHARCTMNELPLECYALAVEHENAGDPERALRYYDRACTFGTQRACAQADRLRLDLAPPPERPFDADAARAEIAHAEERIAEDCENDAETVDAVRATLSITSTGETYDVAFEPALDELFIGACMERILLDVTVPPFDPPDMTLKTTITLTDVPSAFHLATKLAQGSPAPPPAHSR